MATTFRAIVMLLVLVGLPSAWVYYGPLPEPVMGVIQRTLVSAQASLGWESDSASSTWEVAGAKTAPRYDLNYDADVTAATDLLAAQTVVEQSAAALPPVTQDSSFTLASATVEPQTVVVPTSGDSQLAQQLDPHLSLLRSLGAAEYTLENWGSGELYRFRCEVALGQSEDHTRHFQAVNADPLRAVHQVVGEVTSWQNARRANSPTRWQ